LDRRKKIDLTGKQPFKYVINHPMEGMAIEFSDGTVRYLYDNLYSNLWQIKSFIQNVVLNKDKHYFVSDNEKLNVNTEYENFEVFKGNPFFSFRGIMAWSFPVFFGAWIIADHNGPNSRSVPVMVVSFLWLVANSFFMYYFGVSDDFLIVKNHHFLWVRKIIPLADIKEVIFETQGKWPNCMRVVRRDFRTVLYPAGTLSDKKWRELLTVLRKNKVKVRNEIVI